MLSYFVLKYVNELGSNDPSHQAKELEVTGFKKCQQRLFMA